MVAPARRKRRPRARRKLRLKDTHIQREGFLECLAKTPAQARDVYDRHAKCLAPSLHPLVIQALTIWDLRTKGRPRDWKHVVDSFREGDRLWLAVTDSTADLRSYDGSKHLCFVLMRRGWMVEWELFEPYPHAAIAAEQARIQIARHSRTRVA